MTEIRENPAGGNALLASFAYDDRGRRTSLTRGNGTSTSYAYDDVSRLTSLGQDLNGTTNDVTFGYSYNPASQIVSNTRSNDGYSFTGHANGSVSSSVDGLNRLSTHGGTSVTHDGRGNVTAIGSTGYGYTAANRLWYYPPTDTALYYDQLGRLANVVGGGGYQLMIHAGNRFVAEGSGWGGIRRRHVYGPGIDEPIVTYEGSGTSDRRWLHADERGSIVAVSDGSGNLVGSINRYDEYGTPQGGAITGRFGYTGQAWLPELGMYYYRARIYNPALGRFMQTDPIGYGGGMNLYAYVRNDPINRIDPTGLEDLWLDPGIVVRGKRVFDQLVQQHEWTIMLITLRQLQERQTQERTGEEQEIFVQASPLPKPPLLTSPGLPPSVQVVVMQRPAGRDYCGSDGTGWVPDRPAGVDIRSACARHDACYATLGRSKPSCDAQFYNDIFALCMAQSAGVFPGSCSLLAYSYYQGVTQGGQDPYLSAQQEALRRQRR